MTVISGNLRIEMRMSSLPELGSSCNSIRDCEGGMRKSR